MARPVAAGTWNCVRDVSVAAEICAEPASRTVHGCSLLARKQDRLGKLFDRECLLLASSSRAIDTA